MKAVGLVLSGKIFFLCFSHDSPRGGACMVPRGTIGRMYKVAFIHCYTQNRKALGLVVLGKNIILCFSHCKSLRTNIPRGGTIFDPRGMVGRIYKEDHFTLLHTKYDSSVTFGFGEEDFFNSYSAQNIYVTFSAIFGPAFGGTTLTSRNVNGKVQVGNDKEKAQSEKEFPFQKSRWEKTKLKLRFLYHENMS